MEGSLLDGTLRATVPKTIDVLGEFLRHDGTNGGGVLCFVMGFIAISEVQNMVLGIVLSIYEINWSDLISIFDLLRWLSTLQIFTVCAKYTICSLDVFATRIKGP